MEQQADQIATELRRLINDGNLTGIETLLNPITDIAVIDAITAEFSPSDPVIASIEQQREEITLYLLEKCFPYTITYKWADSQCDAWCKNTHSSNGGRCPGSYTALHAAKKHGQRRVVRLIEELGRGGRLPGDGLPPHCVVVQAPGRVSAPPLVKMKVDDLTLPPTQAMQAKLRVAELGHSYMDKNGNFLIHVAASTSAAMVHVCANCKQHINAQNFNGDTALHIAVRENNEETTRALLMNGADLNVRNKLGQTAVDVASGPTKDLLDLYKPGLPAAIQRGDAAVVQRMVRLWCNPAAIIKDKQSALDIAASRCDVDNAAGACLRILQIHRATLALVHNVLSEDLDQLKEILSQNKGWNVNIRYSDVKGVTPVSCALQQHNLAVLMALVETGRCALNIRVREHFSSHSTIPLLFLCLDRDCPKEIWQFLHQHVDPLQAMEKDKNGNTGLLRAISNEHEAGFIKQLVDYRSGLGLLDRNCSGLHARELALSINRADIVAVIDKAVMDRVGDFFLLNLPVNFYGQEHMDIKNEDGQRLSDIVEQPEDVAAISMYQSVEDRAMELFEAAAKGNVEVVKKLNTAPFRDKNGFTALTRAVVFKQGKVVEALVTSQPVLKTTPDNNNRYPLHYAYALKDGQHIIDLLMAKNPHHIEHRVDKDGMEAAEYKALRDTPEIRQMLMAAITVDAYGQTALLED